MVMLQQSKRLGDALKTSWCLVHLVSWAAEPAGSSTPPRQGHSSAPGQGGSRRQQNSAVSGDMEMWWLAMVIEFCQTPAGGNGPCEVLSLLICSLH